MTRSTEYTLRGNRRFRILRIVLGLLLLTSAGLKYHQLTTEPVAEAGIFGSRWFMASAVEIELALSLWLFSGWYPRILWKASFACFTVFAFVVLYRGLSGAGSCGCFGSAVVNPWLVLPLDLSVLAALWYCRQIRPTSDVSAESAVGGYHGLYAACCAFLIVGIPAGWAMARLPASQPIFEGGASFANGVVVLEPDQWIGKHFPLLDSCDLTDQLGSGRWSVVLYHHDCPKCQALISRYTMQGQTATSRVALIEIPPFDTEPAAPSHLLRGRLTDEREWFAVTPLQIALNEGIVVDVAADFE